LTRLFGSLATADYPPGLKVPLVISIDPENGTPNQFVRTVAESFHWAYGQKEIIFHKEHLGLLRNFYYCGGLAGQYGSVIFLEDDSLVSPVFYHYACAALNFFDEDPSVAGISLYRYALNGFTHQPFEPLADGSDVFFMQVSSIMGQAWSQGQWREFEKWRVANTVTVAETNKALHELWSKFPADDHFPILTSYLAATNRYYVFPRVSLTTGFGDAGTHFAKGTSYFQVPLQLYPMAFQFQEMKNSSAIYDSFMEILPACIKRFVPALRDLEFDVDLNATKDRHHIRADYVITSRDCSKPLQSFALAMKPLEANLIFNIAGQGINLCRTLDIRWDRWSEFQTRKRLHDYFARGNRTGLRKSVAYFLIGLLQRRKQ
jgi:hypothetical protein